MIKPNDFFINVTEFNQMGIFFFKIPTPSHPSATESLFPFPEMINTSLFCDLKLLLMNFNTNFLDSFRE